MHSNEPISSLTHFVGFLFSIAGLVLLVVYASLYGRVAQVVGFAIFGSGLILLYLTSAVYHFISREHGAKKFFRIADYAMIYILIASTYTPIMLSLPERGWGWSMFGILWGLSLLGIIFETIKKENMKWVPPVLYLSMGWLSLLILPVIMNSISASGIWWLFLGGILYTLGVVFFVLEKKFPRSGWFGMHEIFHLFVMGGSFSHFWFMFKYVLYI